MYLVQTVNDYRGGLYGFISSHAANTFAVAMFASLLVLASTWFVSKDIKEWKSWKTWVAFVIGAVVAFYITVATPAETPSNLLFIFNEEHIIAITNLRGNEKRQHHF